MNLVLWVGLVTPANEHRVPIVEEILEYNDYDLKQKRYNSHSIIRQYNRILWK
jgi:hypothetical protein